MLRISKFSLCTCLCFIAKTTIFAYGYPMLQQRGESPWKKFIKAFQEKPKQLGQYEILAFAEAQKISPGAGIAFRSYDTTYFGRECSMSIVMFPEMEGIKISYTGLLYFGGLRDQKFYAGAGLGGYALVDIRGKRSSFYPFINTPIFTGVHFRHFFLDVGADLLDGGHIVSPFSRLGWSF